VPLEAIILAVVNSALLFRLGNMQLEGLPTFIGAALALLTATTSLLFNRARAYPAGPVQRRSLLAAELVLRATLLAFLGAVLIALFFPLLQSAGYQPTPAEKWPKQILPTVMAVIPLLAFVVSSLLLLSAGRVLAPTLLMFLRARRIRDSLRS